MLKKTTDTNHQRGRLEDFLKQKLEGKVVRDKDNLLFFSFSQFLFFAKISKRIIFCPWSFFRNSEFRKWSVKVCDLVSLQFVLSDATATASASIFCIFLISFYLTVSGKLREFVRWSIFLFRGKILPKALMTLNIIITWTNLFLPIILLVFVILCGNFWSQILIIFFS